MTPDRPIGVLIMAYGGPDSLADIPGYLADIRDGRVTSPAVLEEITHNYAQIGGRSPLLALSQAQMTGVAAHFDPQTVRFYLGMRHWSPWIEEVVGRMIDAGIRRAVSLVLTPHFSRLSVAKYRAKIAAGLDMYRGDITFAHVDSYHTEPRLIAAFAQRVQTGLEAWPAGERRDVHVVFSAHSLPTRIIAMGDPYDEQLHETAALVARAANLGQEQWSWSYQSAGRSPEPWLGPQLDEHLRDLAARGHTKVVSIPIGFVCDHVEILYDIDIAAQEVANEVGIRLVRPPALNSDPLFVDLLADIISHKITELRGNG